MTDAIRQALSIQVLFSGIHIYSLQTMSMNCFYKVYITVHGIRNLFEKEDLFISF